MGNKQQQSQTQLSNQSNHSSKIQKNKAIEWFIQSNYYTLLILKLNLLWLNFYNVNQILLIFQLSVLIVKQINSMMGQLGTLNVSNVISFTLLKMVLLKCTIYLNYYISSLIRQQTMQETFESQFEHNQHSNELTSLVLYCNIDKLPQELTQGSIKYKLLLNKVIIPFFSIRQRYITQGVQFNIGQFEFKVLGASPKKGFVGTKTEIYCYNHYSTAPTIQSMIIAPLKKTKYSNQSLQHQLVQHLLNNPTSNNLQNDQQIKINNIDLMILKSNPTNGKVTSDTQIEVSTEPLKEIVNLLVICLEMPQQLSQQFNSNNIEQAILKTIIIPYFTGMNRYIQRGQHLQINDFQFQFNCFEQKGIVIPFKTQIQMQLIRIPQNPNDQNFEESKEQFNYPEQQQGHQRSHAFQFTEYLERRREPRLLFNSSRRRQDILSQTIFQSRDRRAQQLQQIEALHQLLNAFILLNEHPQMQQILNQNQGLNQAQINRLPERGIDLEFLKTKNLLDEDHMKCHICLLDYENQEGIRTLPCCNLHYFHVTCIDSWLTKSKLCPICKNSCEMDGE